MRHLIRLVALRHAAWSPLRTALTILGIALGVAAFVAIATSNQAIVQSFQGTVTHLSGKTDLEIGNGDAPLPEELLERLLAVRGVQHASPVVEAKARHSQSNENILVLGVDLTGDDYFRDYKTVDGEMDAVEFLNCRNCLMLSKIFADRQQLKSGDTLRLRTPHGEENFLIKEILSDEGPAKAFGGNIAVMYLDAAQLLFERQGRYDRIDLALDPTLPREQLIAAVQNAAGPGIAVEEPARRGERTVNMMARFQVALTLGSFIAILVSMFMIYNTVGIAVAQRRREIGMLRALGVTRGEVRGLFVGEALILGVVGSALGLVLGVALSNIVVRAISLTVSSMYVELNVKNAQLTFFDACIAMIVGIVATGVAAYLPAREASVTAPALSMQRGVGSSARQMHWRLSVGLFALGCGLVFISTHFALAYPQEQMWGNAAMMFALLGAASLSPLALSLTGKVMRRPMMAIFGVSGRLAADNLTRQGSRAVITVASLTVGVGLAMGTSIFLSGFQTSIKKWMDQTIPANLFVTGSSRMIGKGAIRLPISLLEELRALPESRGADIEPVCIRKFNLDQRRMSIISVNFDIRLRRTQFMLTGGAPLHDPHEFTDDRAIMVSDNLATQLKLQPGDDLPLNTPTGVKHYRIRAVYIDYTSDYGNVLLDRIWYVQDFLDDTVDSYEIYTLDNAQIPILRKSILSHFGAEHDLFVLTNQEFKQEIAETVDNSFRATSAMSTLAVLVALLGIINTLFAAILDRTRELGVLRAIGTSLGQLVLAILCEAGLLALSAALMGIVTGLALGAVFVFVVNVANTGWRIGFYPPWDYQLQLVGWVVAAATLAGAWPAWKAGREKIIEALSYD